MAEYSVGFVMLSLALKVMVDSVVSDIINDPTWRLRLEIFPLDIAMASHQHASIL